MATVYGVNKTLARDATGSNIVEGGQLKGKERVMYDTYELDSTASGTIIELGEKMPKNARVVDVELMTDAMGSGVTVIIGDYEDDNRYITATTINTANLRTRLKHIDGMGYKMDETTATDTGTDRQLIATTGGATGSGTFKVKVTYIQE